MNLIEKIQLVYIFLINITAFMLMGIDKRKAKKREWRIKENTLFFIALIGGSIGSIMGMQYYHHKTKHRKFVFGMPVIAIIQIVVFVCYKSFFKWFVSYDSLILLIISRLRRMYTRNPRSIYKKKPSVNDEWIYIQHMDMVHIYSFRWFIKIIH